MSFPRFTVVFPDFQRNNTQGGDYPGWTYTYKTVAASTSEVNIRYYPGNSFNWLLGYGKYKIELKDWPSEDSTTYDIAYEATQVNFGLGNEWTFDFGMYIGADWLMTGSKSQTTPIGRGLKESP